MNPELQVALAELARRVEALEKTIGENAPQQIKLPLDLASIEVLKAALIRAGFTYP